MKAVWFTDSEHRRALALVRCQALIERSPEWDELLELLETDRPRRETVVPLASRRADLDEPRLVKARRLDRLQRLGQAEALRLVKGGLL